jgi:hypothetical protein
VCVSDSVLCAAESSAVAESAESAESADSQSLQAFASPDSGDCQEVSSHVELHGSAGACSGSPAATVAVGMGRVKPPGMELFAEKPGMPWLSVVPVSSLLIEHSLLA